MCVGPQQASVRAGFIRRLSDTLWSRPHVCWTAASRCACRQEPCLLARSTGISPACSRPVSPVPQARGAALRLRRGGWAPAACTTACASSAWASARCSCWCRRVGLVTGWWLRRHGSVLLSHTLLGLQRLCCVHATLPLVQAGKRGHWAAGLHNRSQAALPPAAAH